MMLLNVNQREVTKITHRDAICFCQIEFVCIDLTMCDLVHNVAVCSFPCISHISEKIFQILLAVNIGNVQTYKAIFCSHL